MAYGVILGQQPDFSKYIEKSEKGQPNGVCPLGEDGKIPLEYGGGVPITLTANVEADAVVTTTNGDTTLTATSNGKAVFSLPKAGEWTTQATKNGRTSNSVKRTIVDRYTADLTFFSATLNVIAEKDSAVTATFEDNETVLTKHSEGTVSFDIPLKGTWTVKATKGSEMSEKQISITKQTTYSLDLSYYKTYTVKIQLNNANSETACTYADDAVGKTPGYNGWKDTNLFKNIRPCVVKNVVFQYYLNKNNLAQKENGASVDITSINTGDVMIEIPKIGYKMWRDSQYQYVSVTEKKNEPGYCYRAHSLDTEGDCDKIYIGAFLGWNSGNKIYSLSGKSPVVNITLTNARSYAQARGKGYSLVSFYPLVLLQCLYLIKYKNRNSQVALGKGWTSQSAKTNTGGTVAKGEDYGEQGGTQQMCFCNIEDFWGNLRWWIDGLYSDGSRNIKTAFKNFNDNGSGYPYSHASGAGSKISGWISDIQGTNDSGFVIKGSSGSSSTYYADYGSLYGGCCGYFGGYWYYGDYVGAFQLYVSDAASYSYSNLGCRLMFKHKEVN